MRDAGLDGLVTERLVLRRCTPADEPSLVALGGDPEVMRYLGGPESPEQTRALLDDRILRYYEEHPGFGIWATVERASGALVGFHLLNDIRDTANVQVGYRLHRAYWGRGYATEMTVALLRYGFEQRGLAQITAITHRENLASQRVLVKSGLRQNGERSFSNPHYAGYGPMAWFEADAAEWLAGQKTDR